MGTRLTTVMSIVALAGCTEKIAQLATAEPGVVYTYPIDAQVDVPLGARVLVTFSDPVEKGALGACSGTGDAVTGAFCLVGPDGPVDATAEVVGEDKTVQLTGLKLAPGTTYALYARAALAPDAANLPASGPLIRFTTRAEQPRAAAPALVAVNGGPPTAPEAFRPMFESSTIRLVFSEPLDPRTVTAGAVSLLDAAGKPVPATLIAQGIHVALDPITDLTAGATYQLKLTNLADLGGQRVPPTTIMLTPRSTGASRPIVELMKTRQDGDGGPELSHAGAKRNEIAIDKPLVGRETAQIQPSVLQAELGDPAVLDGPLAFTIRRGQRLRTTGLDVKLGGELAVGLRTGDIWIELLTDAGGRIYRNPHQPADQRPENLRAPLYVDLSMDVAVYADDPAGNAVLTQTVLGVQASGAVVATDGVLDIESVIAMDLGLLGVARAPTNLVLELITDPTAQRSADTDAPRLLSSMPATAGELPVDDGVELIFSEPIDLDRARAGGLALQTTGGAAVPSVIESHGAAVVIRPTAPLAYSTAYKVALTDVTDVAGNPMAGPPAMSFTTPQLAAASAAMTIASIYPGAPCALTGATATSPGRCAGGGGGDAPYRPFALPANEAIHVTFTQPARPTSVVAGTACGTGSVRVEEISATGACVAAVPGTLIHHDRALGFVPDTPWRVGTHYRLTLVSGGDGTCDANELCGPGGAASFDPLAGANGRGGPNLVVDFAGALATDATFMVTGAAPFSDVNGSGFLDAGERRTETNRVALRIADTGGTITSASFGGRDCLPDVAGTQGCMYLSGDMPVELQPVAHDCALPGGATAATCVPIALSPQAMYATSVDLDATLLGFIPLSSSTAMSVLRIREPADGPVTGYLIDDAGTPTLVLDLQLYLDAQDLSGLPLGGSHDLHSKPMAVSLRGPMRFLADGRIAIAVENTADVPISVNVKEIGIDAGSVSMVVPRGEMKIQLVSPPLRGGLP
jgi:hypothetical protein